MLWDSLEEQPKFPEPIFSLALQASFLPNQFSLFLKGLSSTSDRAMNLLPDRVRPGTSKFSIRLYNRQPKVLLGGGDRATSTRVPLGPSVRPSTKRVHRPVL